MPGNKMIQYRGAGGKGGGRAAIEGENTLRSTQEAEVIELLSEGPIVGIVSPEGNVLTGGDELQSIYLNNIPIQNANGTFNFQNTELDFDYRLGTQVQTPLNGYADSGKRTTFRADNNSEIKQVFPSGISQIVSNTDLQVRAIEIVIGITQFYQQNKKTGDTVATTVEFEIWLKEGANGSFYKVQDAEISGKTTTKFQKPYLIYVTGNQPQYTIQVRRITPDRATQVDPDFAYQDIIYLDSYTVIRSQSLNYPNSAVIRLRLKSDQFSSIPSRAYLIKGKLIKVPSNYNPNLPHNRFVGAWDGTFKLEWTDNPAWIFYDLATNTIYGLGDYLSATETNKWALYEIGKYCDEPVPDGFGGMELRYACNVWITSDEEAFSMLHNLASVFMGMHYWAAAQLNVYADTPKDAVHTFTQANIVGNFNYSGTSLKSRHTVANVVWNDPDDFCKQKVEYVELQDKVVQWGAVPIDITGFGCTSRGQAHRLGKSILFTENYETETVTFQAALDSTIILPGDVFEVADAPRYQQRYGGRIVSVSGNVIELDAPVPNGSYTLAVLGEDLNNLNRANAPKLIKIPGTVSSGTIFTASGSTAGAVVNHIWTLESVSYGKELFRAISIEESDGLYTISGLEYWPAKYGFIEQDLVLQPGQGNTTNPGTGGRGVGIDTPVFTGSWYVEYLYYSAPGILSTGVTVSWIGNSPRYRFYYRKAGEFSPGLDITDRWQTIESEISSVDIKPIEPFTYEVKVVGLNAAGTETQEATGTMSILGKAAPPADVTNLTIAEAIGGLKLTWDEVPDLDLAGYQVRRFKGINPSWFTADVVAGALPENSFLDADVLATDTYTYYVKAIDTSGNESINPAVVTWNIGSGINNITNLIASGETGAVTLTWTNPINAEVFVKYIEVFYNNINDFSTASSAGTTSGEIYRVPLSGTGTWYFWARVRDRNGNDLPEVGPATAAPVDQEFRNATVFLFQWSTTLPNAPTGTQIYTWATDNLSPYAGLHNWGTSIGVNPGIPQVKLWVASTDITTIGNIPTTTVNWDTAKVSVYSSEDGAEGDFLQSTEIKVYQQSITIPAGPTGVGTYTWSNGNFSAPSGWSKTPGSPIPGMSIYSANILLQDTKAASTTSINWVQARIQLEGYNGTDGAPGAPGAPGAEGAQGASYRIAFARFANVSPVQGTVTTTGNATYPTAPQSNSAWGMNTAWVANDPSPSSINSLYQIDGIYNPTTNQTTWTTPYISSLKVGTLSAITVNTGALNVTGDLLAGNLGFNSSTGLWNSGAGMKLYSSGWFGVGNSNNYTTIYNNGLRIKGNLNLGSSASLLARVDPDTSVAVGYGFYSGFHLTKANSGGYAGELCFSGINTYTTVPVVWYHKGTPSASSNYSGYGPILATFQPNSSSLAQNSLAYFSQMATGNFYAGIMGFAGSVSGDYSAGGKYAKGGLFLRSSYISNGDTPYAASRVELAPQDVGVRVLTNGNLTSYSAVFARYAGYPASVNPAPVPNPATAGTSMLLVCSSSYAINTGGYNSGIRTNSSFYGGDYSSNGASIIVASGGKLVQNVSDIRLKNVLGYAPYGLDEIKQITPIRYTWKDTELRGSHISIGFSAQQLQNILPELVEETVVTHPNGEKEDNLVLKEYQLLPVLVNAIKELEAQVAELRARLDNA